MSRCQHSILDYAGFKTMNQSIYFFHKSPRLSYYVIATQRIKSLALASLPLFIVLFIAYLGIDFLIFCLLPPLDCNAHEITNIVILFP